VKYCDEANLVPRMELLDDGTSNRPTISAIKFFLETRIREYFDHSEIIYYDKYRPESDKLQDYVQKPQELGYVQLDALYKTGTKLVVRTMNGDMDLVVEPGVVLLIGMDGEITAIPGRVFIEQYLTLEEFFQLDGIEYAPTIKNNMDNKILQLLSEAKTCISKKEEVVQAKKLEQKTKLFTKLSEDDYLIGNAGDYLVIRPEEPQDMNIVKKERFESDYVKK
jgi:phosphoglycolate phosphatase